MRQLAKHGPQVSELALGGGSNQSMKRLGAAAQGIARAIQGRRGRSCPGPR